MRNLSYLRISEAHKGNIIIKINHTMSLKIILFCLVVFICLCEGWKVGQMRGFPKNYLDENDYAEGRKVTQKRNNGVRKLMENRNLFEGYIMGLNSNSLQSVVMKLNKQKEKLRGKHKELANEQKATNKDSKERVYRNRSVRKTTILWPKTGNYIRIPHEISPQYSTDERSVIARAMADFERCTCIRFVKREIYDNSYIVIEPVEGWGCWSWFGMKGGKQTVSLTRGPPNETCLYHATVQHEIMHALGFFHEQSRMDRDNYVAINWENIKAGQKYNFKKYDNRKALGTKYDYNSIMHYRSKAFSANNQPTIIAKEPGVHEFGAGEAAVFSQTDIDDINLLYECPNADTKTEGCAKGGCDDWYNDCGLYKHIYCDDERKNRCKKTCDICN